MPVGSVAALATDGEQHPVPLVAATFTGGGRVLTTLVPENLLEAETLAQETVGLKLTGTTTVGRTRQRAVGFPAWPIITDPGNARHALNLVADLEWARRQAGTQAKKVKARFDALSSDLQASAPHFVPTLLEELARIFATAGSPTLAKQYFSRAREVERSHNVPVDAERHRAAFLEFARLGVLGAKDLAREASDAAVRLKDPAEAFGYVLGINAACIQAGQPPYTAMLRDLRKLGTAAGLSEQESDTRVFDEIIGLTPLYKAPEGWWKSADKSLLAWMAEHPEADSFFRARIPAAFSIERWLNFLEDGHVWERLAADTRALAQWVVLTINREFTHFTAFSPGFLAAIEKATPQLAGETVSMNFNAVSPDYFDALIEADVTLVATKDQWGRRYSSVPWGLWVKQKVHPRELSFLAADQGLKEKTRSTLTSEFIAEHLDLLLSKEGTRRLVSEHLEEMAAATTSAEGSLPFLARNYAEDLKHLDDERLAELHPDAVEKMFRYDPSVSLAAALRNGVLAELSWPAVEEAVEKLRAENPDERLQVFDSYPQLVATCGERFAVVDGETVTVTGDLPADTIDITGAFVLGEDVVFYYYPQPWTPYVYWNGQAAQEITASNGTRRHNIELSLPMGDGRRLSAFGLLSPGDVDIEHKPTNLISDGERIVTFRAQEPQRWDHDGEAFEAIEGDLGFGPIDLLDGEVDWANSHMFPAEPTTQGSPAGVRDGLHFTLRVDHPDGPPTYLTPLGEFASPAPVDQVLARPGGGHWLQVGRQLRDASTGQALSARSGILDHLPLTAVHQLRPRAPEASIRMREFTAESAQEILDALVPEPENTVTVPVTQLHSYWYHANDAIETVPASNAVPGTAAWEKAAELIGSTDPQLVAAVVGMAVDAQTLSANYRRSVSKSYDLLPLSEEAAWLLSDLAGFTQEPVDAATCEQLFTQLAQILDTRSPATYKRHQSDKTLLFSIIGHERRLLQLLDSPALDTEVLASLKGFLLSLVDAGVLASGWRSYRADERSDTEYNTLGAPAWIDANFVTGFSPQWEYPGYLVLAQHPPHELAGHPVIDTEDPQMNAEEFRAALAELPTERDLATEAQVLAEGTNLTLGEATVILGGLLGRADARWMSKKSAHDALLKSHQQSLGLAPATFTKATKSLRSMPTDLLYAMAMGTDAAEKAAIWRRLSGDLGHRLTDSEHDAIRATMTYPHENSMHVLTPLPSDSGDIPRFAINALLVLASLRRSDDAIRLFLAEQLTSARSSIQPNHSGLPLGGNFDTERIPWQHTFQALAEGHIDELIADLHKVYDSPAGHPMDPVVSAPEVVAAVEKALGLGTDQARYYLQVLALASPTDASIKEWNGWRKKDLDAAAAPLVERGLLLEAKRSGTGRSRFLPGGWLPPTEANKGLEVWKAPLYLVWKDVKFRPIFRTSPPLVPMPRLFSDAWQRFVDGDAPGYEELNTTRYRRRN